MSYKTEPYILYAEDDEDDQEMFMEIVSKFDPKIQIHFFPDGLSLIRYLEMVKNIGFPIFILLDINMPVWDGFQTLQTLRGIYRYNSIPIILYSISTSPFDKKRGLELGANDFMPKPNSQKDFDMVYEKLSKYLVSLMER